MTKFWENSGQLYDKRILSKKLILAFFSDCYVPNPKEHAKPPILGNWMTLPENCLLSVFSMLGTKMINNNELTQYVNPKQNYLKRVFSVFYVEKR